MFCKRDTLVDEEVTHMSQSHQMGIQGPNIAYEPVHGVFLVILLYLGPIEAM